MSSSIEVPINPIVTTQSEPHVSNSMLDIEQDKKTGKQRKSEVNWLWYDLILWLLSLLIDLFFREVKTRGSFKVPRRSAIIFVAAPHANQIQFVDPLLLMRQVRLEAGRRISFLIAAKSMQRQFIGAVAKAVGGIPVSRAQDLQTNGTGTIYLEDRRQPLKLSGRGTRFLTEGQIGGSIVLPGDTTGSSEIASIESETSLTLKREFKGLKALELLQQPESGTRFKFAPKVDQSVVYNEVFKRLNDGGCVGIFPEGGSHDRTELLPLKAGVAIMALGALVKNPNCDLKIVPCGMNYFHAHRFRSRAVIEFGSPLTVPQELVELYKDPSTKREATKQLLDTIYNALVSVTVQAADYETLMVIQAGRRLYKPAHKKLPLQSVVELNRRFITGYNHFKDEPRVRDLKDKILKYNRDLYLMGIRDHQLTSFKLTALQVFGKLMYRSMKLTLLAIGSLPGILLFGPVFVATKLISKQKAKEALAGSSVKIQGRDVLATWKLLVAMGLAPSLYIFYAILGTWVAHRFEIGPDYVRSQWPIWTIPLITMVLLPMATYSALRFGEVGMDIYKSLRPLLLAITNGDILDELQDRRDMLANELTLLINTLGPTIFDDFEAGRIIALPEHMIKGNERSRRRSSSGASDMRAAETPNLTTSSSPPSSGYLSPQFIDVRAVSDLAERESFSTTPTNPFFATVPPSRRSHSRQSSFKDGLTTVQMSQISQQASETNLDEVSQKIRALMQRRRSEKNLKGRANSLQQQQQRLSVLSDSLTDDEGIGLTDSVSSTYSGIEHKKND